GQLSGATDRANDDRLPSRVTQATLPAPGRITPQRSRRRPRLTLARTAVTAVLRPGRRERRDTLKGRRQKRRPASPRVGVESASEGAETGHAQINCGERVLSPHSFRRVWYKIAGRVGHASRRRPVPWGFRARVGRRPRVDELCI